jgi:hypothetical protein
MEVAINFIEKPEKSCNTRSSLRGGYDNYHYHFNNKRIKTTKTIGRPMETQNGRPVVSWIGPPLDKRLTRASEVLNGFKSHHYGKSRQAGKTCRRDNTERTRRQPQEK